ncbi:MAG TPA: helix-turn-helix transcriptional regulator [Solimonas sp.]|jgi:ribosome-binding protein aMBF1 (putative translation factor)|nr:helix-turn-helix transcriptional regulator [Solimonas sp.]
MSKLKNLHSKWLRDPEYREAYDALDKEYSLALAIVRARVGSGLTQEEVARRMKTTQSTIARMEAGRTVPSTRTLERFARATGTHLRISFESGHA